MRLLNNRRFTLALVIIIAYALATVALAADGSQGADSGHGGQVLETLLGLIVVLISAKLGGDILERFHQPAVLGELIIGMIIGNLHLVGFTGFEVFKGDIVLQVLAEVGVIILLFQVGLESTVKGMMEVGVTSFLVATFGVIAPFFLGWGVGAWFLPEESIYVHVFIGATLTATSVGITARVLKDIGKIQTKEAKIILGAAVIDDILGLVILAVVAGIIKAASTGSEGVSSLAILWIIAKAVLFVAGAIILGKVILPPFFRLGFRLRVTGVFLSFCLLVCFALAYLAGEIGLAPIVGAFAAGLILEDAHYRDFYDRGEHHIEELVEPIAIFLVPIFFVRMGMMVDLTTFTHLGILGFAAVMTLAAIVGKQVCALAVFDRTVNRLAVGLGMIPRGEVGLIFAGIGATLMLNGHAVISTGTYSAVVIMVIVTTMVTPPVLKAALLRGDRKRVAAEQSDTREK